MQMKNNALMSAIKKSDSQIKQKETGDELKFIDFHQLQIQNKK